MLTDRESAALRRTFGETEAAELEALVADGRAFVTVDIDGEARITLRPEAGEPEVPTEAEAEAEGPR